MASSSKAPELYGLDEAGAEFAGDSGKAEGYGAIAKGQLPPRRRPSLPPLSSGNSVLLTSGIIIADVVGAGILSMGSAVAKFGWLLGSIFIFALLAMNVHVSLLIWRVRMGCPTAFTYVDLASQAFRSAPEWQRRAIEGVTLGSQQMFLFLVLALYSLSVGRCLGTLFYDELRVCLPVLVLIGLVGFMPVHLSSRSLGEYKSLIALNVLTIMGSCFIPLVHMAFSGVEQTRAPDAAMKAFADLTVAGTLSGLEVMSFAFTSQFMLVEIIAEMRDPAEFPNAYMISAPFQGIMFVIAGVGAYYFMGSAVNGIIGENLPFGPTFRAAAFCLLVHMLITFLIKGVVFCRWIQQVWNPSGLNDTSWKGWSGWSVSVVTCTALCWLFAQVVPFFTDFMDLLGASLTPLACYIIPIVLYCRWHYDNRDKTDRSIGPIEGTCLVLEVLLSLILMIFGTYFSLKTIVGKWKTYGMPFECHCQNIWATCECSAHHAGMEHCLAES